MDDWIYLASKSPRRQELLTTLGVGFRLLLPDDPVAAETLEAVRPGEPPPAYVVRVTLAKLEAAMAARAARDLPPAPILAADTTVALGGRILGKPIDRDDAIAMLAALSGRTHRVLTAVALVGRNGRRHHRLNASRVRFGRISRGEIERYVDSGDPMDKAGSYGIQGAAGRFVRRIEGSHSGIMGLPLYETAELLRRC